MIGQILSWGCEGSVLGKQTQGLPQCPAERPKQSWGEIFFHRKKFQVHLSLDWLHLSLSWGSFLYMLTQ